MITNVESRVIDRRTPSQLNTSYSDAPMSRDRVIVTITDDSGQVGYGEASPLPYFTGETARSIEFMLRESFFPLLIGREPFSTGSIHESLSLLPGHSSAKAAIDIALHDLQGKITRRPAVDLIGGKMRDQIAVTFPIGITDVQSAVDQAAAATDRGIGTLKMKIGRDPDADVARVRAVRSAVGPDVKIRIDANSGYTVPTAIQILGRLAESNIEYMEQPVAPWDLEGLARVRERASVPIMADESLHNLRDAQRLLQLGAADIFAIKLIKTSGIYFATAIARLAAAHKIDVVVISPFETQIGAAAGLAVALSSPSGHRAHELRVFDSQPDMAETDITFSGGFVYPSSEAGLGVRSIVELGKEPAQ